MNQHEFYQLPEVIEQVIRQKCYPHGHSINKIAHEKKCEIAKRYGVWDEFVKSGGSVYE